jgi:predicted deacetylase
MGELNTTYLIRFDDICATMNWEVWREVELLLDEAGVKPILAVVPDNQDPELHHGPAAPDFWARVREWQAKGWTIAMHGYQHRYVTENAGLVPLNRRSEFAGLSREEQLAKLIAASDIFARHGIQPEAWVAPSHSFDDTTVSILKDLGVRAISDGLAARPFRCPEGMLWVPQQIWRMRRMPAGVWTVCYHHNDWAPSHIEKLARDVHFYRDQITTFRKVCETYNGRRKTLRDRVVGIGLLLMIYGSSYLPRPGNRTPSTVATPIL